MDYAECTQHVGQAISKLDGVASVDVLLATEKAIIRLDPAKVTMPALREAVASAGDYSVPESAPSGSGEKEYPVAREGGVHPTDAERYLQLNSPLALIGQWKDLYNFCTQDIRKLLSSLFCRC